MNTTQKDHEGRVIGRYAGLQERRAFKNVRVIVGAGVGGGSLHYSCVTGMQTRDAMRTVLPQINYDEMESKYYPRARSVLKASPVPQDILKTDYYAGTRVFLQQAATAGLPHQLVDLAVDWDIVREELSGKRKPSIIIGEVHYGTNSGAKRSLDTNYLAAAEKTGVVSIMPLHTVLSVEEVPGHGYRLECHETNDTGEVLRTKSIVCKHLFLAAGSLGTTGLLLKAKAENTLSRLNDDVGRHWGQNGIHFAMRHSPEPINPMYGGPAGGRIDVFDSPHGPISIENFPGAPDDPLGQTFTMAVTIPGRLGTVRYDKATKDIDVDWPASDPANLRGRQAQKYVHAILDERNKVTPAQIEPLQAESPDGLVDRTSHPLGGVVLGRACDWYGRVVGHSGLYVVDGALLPGCTGTMNPSLPIAAFAERAMENVMPEILARR